MLSETHLEGWRAGGIEAACRLVGRSRKDSKFGCGSPAGIVFGCELNFWMKVRTSCYTGITNYW